MLAAPLCEGKTVIEAKGDILIVPQATLGGKLKGKSLQYVPMTDRPTPASQGSVMILCQPNDNIEEQYEFQQLTSPRYRYHTNIDKQAGYDLFHALAAKLSQHVKEPNPDARVFNGMVVCIVYTLK